MGALTLIEGPPPGAWGWLLAGIDDEAERAYALDDSVRHPLLSRRQRPRSPMASSARRTSSQTRATSRAAPSPGSTCATTARSTAPARCRAPPPSSPRSTCSGHAGGARGPKGPRERLRAMTTPLRRAVEVYVRLRHMRAMAQIDDAMLDRLDVAALALSPAGRTLRANASARALLARGDGITEREGSLRCTHPSANAPPPRGARRRGAPAATRRRPWRSRRAPPGRARCSCSCRRCATRRPARPTR